MSIALSEFWNRLVRLGITDAEGCKQLAMGFAKANRGTPPSDAKSLAKFMIVRGELNTFQARALIADRLVELRFGGYLLRGADLPSPMSRWAEASRISDGQVGYLLRTSPNELSGGREQWMAANLEVTSPSLQTFDLEATPPTACVFSPLPAGTLLHNVLATQGKLSARQTCQIGICLSDAMESLHARPLNHGAIRTDRVWLCDDGEAILLRDPSGPPVAPNASVNQSSSGWFDDVDPPHGYAAPEFADSQQPCDPSTDIYSLGCLLYRTVAGKLPFEADSAAKAIALHASETPPEIAKAVAEGEKGEPLYRVIAFAMAKNRDARFRSAGQLAAALRVALPLLKDEPKAVAQPKPEGNQESIKPKKDKRRKATAADQTTQPDGPAKQNPVKKESVATNLESGPKPSRASVSKEHRKSKEQSKPQQQSKPKTEPPVESTRRDDVPTKPQSKAAETTSPPPLAAPPVSEPTPPEQVPPEPIPPQSVPSISVSDPVEPPPTAPAKRQPGTRRRRKKKSKAPLFLGALCVAVLLLIIGLLVHDPNKAVEDDTIANNRRRLPTVVPSVTGKRPVEDTEPSLPVAPAGYSLVDSDRLLFVPPFANDDNDAPLDLLPPGPAAILTVDLAAIASSAMGSSFTESIDPELEGLLNLVAKRSGVPIGSIRRCTAAFHPGKKGWPEVSLAVQLKDPQTRSELENFWKAAPARTSDGATIYASDIPDRDAYYIPDVGETVTRFAVGSVPRVSEVAADEGAAILLPRSLQQLWNSSSTEADFALLITPNFLFADGREMLISAAPEMIAPLKSVLIPDVSAVFVVADFVDDQVFLETRLTPSGGVSEIALMRSFDQTVKGWPAWAEEFIVDSIPDASWRLLASRMPAMMRFVSDQTRVGVSNGAVVANTYLPANALSQLTVATLLAMNTKPGGDVVGIAVDAPAKKLSMEELLARKMSVSFEQESLEFAIDAIIGDYKRKLPAGNTMPSVRIVGSDLQKMGITQNQQVRDFSKSNVSLRSVLTDLVVKANPDKSATGPRDPKQALIWVVAEDPENPGKQVILVTTRQAAEKKYQVPTEFQPAK